MELESYNKELVYATAMFMDALSNIHITRNNKKKIRVKCLNASRSRIFKSLENPHKTMIQPPIIAISRTGLERDSKRVTDLNNHILKQINGNINYDLYPPNPINITFELSIVAKYQVDMDMILSNFIPFCNQSFFVTTMNPKNPTQELRHEIIWDGTISEEDKSEIDFETIDLREATTSFTFKTWIWAGTINDTNIEEEGLIKKINVQPNLCSLGTQQLMYKNGVSDSESLCALSGFMLDDKTYYDDIYSLSHWYAVDRSESFDDYMKKIELGRIDPLFYDSLPISGNVSGYVRDLDLDLLPGDPFDLDGSEMYFVDNEGGIVIYAETSGLTEPFSASCQLESDHGE